MAVRASTFRNRPGRWPKAWIAAAMLVLVGCGDAFDVAEVSGRVVRDGAPVPRVLVSFQPSGGSLSASPGPGSYGVTDNNGAFTLKFVADDRLGAVVGNHRIVLKHSDDVGKAPLEETMDRFENPDAPAADDRQNMEAALRMVAKSRTIPKRFRDGTIQFVVPPEGTDEAVFDLAK